jgi:hypothetical protein
MRLQHTKLAAASLSTDDADRVTAKATIVAEVERLRWRIWNGKAQNAQRSIDRIRKVIHVFKGENRHRTKGVPSRQLWHALHEVDQYLSRCDGHDMAPISCSRFAARSTTARSALVRAAI